MRTQRRSVLRSIGAGMLALTAGCTQTALQTGSTGRESTEPNTPTDGTIRIATTTSTYDSGIVDALSRAFTDNTGISVQAIAQGTGAALATGRAGDCDVVFVHAPSLEAAFVADGYGIDRCVPMMNDFVIVGPESDPADIGSQRSVSAAFSKIATSETEFISRGDNSGTHIKELELWEHAAIAPSGGWYLEAGQGMGNVLMMAAQRGAYTLTDRGTYLSMGANAPPSLLLSGPVEDGDRSLANPYGAMAVNPDRHEHVRYNFATQYLDFLMSEVGQTLIETYRVNDEPLFVPLADDETGYGSIDE